MNEIQTLLQRLQPFLQNLSSADTEWLAKVNQVYSQDIDAFYKHLNSKRMWGGAGSIANQALADNPGLEEWIWQSEIQQFRELMIELGEHLQARGDAYPDISSWLLAFNNWNQSGV